MLLPLQTFGNKTSIYSSYCLEIKTLADDEGIHHGLGVGEAVLLLVLLGGAPVRGPDHPRQPVTSGLGSGLHHGAGDH